MTSTQYSRLIIDAASQTLPPRIADGLTRVLGRWMCEPTDANHLALLSTVNSASLKYKEFALLLGMVPTPPRTPNPEELDHMMPGPHWGRYKARLIMTGSPN